MNRLKLEMMNLNPQRWLARCLAAGVLMASTMAFAQEMPPPAQQAPPQEDNGQAAGGWPDANPQTVSPQDGNVAQPAPDGPAYPQQQPPPQAAPNYGQRSDGQRTSNVPAYGGPGYGGPGAYGNNQNPYGQAPSGRTPSGQEGQQQPYSPQPYGQPNYGQRPYPQQAPPPIPASLMLSPGAYVTVRLNQQLTSNKNRNGDAFTATLAEPLVVNGIVVAEPGQTVGGVVADAEKSNPAKLVVQLTELSLVDGQRLPIETKLVARRGPGFNGQDAGTIIGTTAIGAGIGAVADWGTGAAIGAGVGLVVGALITHNHPSVLYPEQVLTFRIDAPAGFSTQASPQAFHYVEPGEYDRAPYQGQGPIVRTAPVISPYYGAYGYPYGWGNPYGYWGPGVGLYFGRGYYGHGYYGGNFYGGRGGYRR